MKPINTFVTNDFYKLCQTVSDRAESKLKDCKDEQNKIFLQGIMYTSALLGRAYHTSEPTPIAYDYNKFLNLYALFEKETKAEEKAHQISMEEYLKEKNKEDNVNDLAKQVANIIMKEFKGKYNKKDK